MIISHKHRFIFVKLRKTAGTSLEIALSGICGEDDIITPISKADEKIRQDLGYRGAQNYESVPFYNHMPAVEIKESIPSGIWNDYFKFCFERNPWDKTVSHYFHRNRAGSFSGIMDYLEHDEKDGIKGFDMYSTDGKVVMDKVFRYEDMDAALQEISKTLGLPEILKMPGYKAKSQFRTDSRHYREILSNAEMELISQRFSREIEYMDYTP